MSTNQLEMMMTFEDAMKAEEKIVFLVEYLKSDQFYPEYCTEVSQRTGSLGPYNLRTSWTANV